MRNFYKYYFYATTQKMKDKYQQVDKNLIFYNTKTVLDYLRCWCHICIDLLNYVGILGPQCSNMINI